jgi:chromosome transmission fidelity protein 4
VSHLKGEGFPSTDYARILKYRATRDDKTTLAGRGLSSKTFDSACRSGERTARKVPWNNSTLPSGTRWVQTLTRFDRLATETLHLDALRDALGPDDLTSDEIAAKELELDRTLIVLIQNACKNDKLPRALDLVKMLHHTASYDMAAKVAGFYHLVGLQEKIETLKVDREEGGDEEDEYGVDPREVARRKREQWRREGSGAVPPPRPVGESSRSAGYNGAKKAFQDFGPPPAIHRPGLTRAGGGFTSSQSSSLAVGLPSSSLAGGSGSSYREASPTNDIGSYDWEEEQSMSISTAGLVNEGKRKRDHFDEPTTDTFDVSNEGAKRRALGQPKAS